MENFYSEDFIWGLDFYCNFLLEVILRVGEWVLLVLESIVFRVWDVMVVMLDWMVFWVF